MEDRAPARAGGVALLGMARSRAGGRSRLGEPASSVPVFSVVVIRVVGEMSAESQASQAARSAERDAHDAKGHPGGGTPVGFRSRRQRDREKRHEKERALKFAHHPAHGVEKFNAGMIFIRC